MNSKKPNMKDLEEELASIENYAVAEEQDNADKNYNSLHTELENEKNKIPFPEVGQYATGRDYAEMFDI